MAETALSVIEAAAAPEVVGQILAIRIADVVVADRLRPIDPIWAQALAGLMAPAGHNDTPIEVCRLPGRNTFLLVVGGHRLEGGRINGWDAIRAVVVSADALQRRLREIWENLGHSGLGPLDRAAFVAELVQIHKVQAGIDPGQDGRAVSAQARWQKVLKTQAADASGAVTLAYGWTDEVAARMGLSRETVYRDLSLHRGLPAHLVARLRSLPIASNAGQLRALAKMTDADQRAVVDLLVEGKAKGAGEALGLLRQKPKPDMQKKAWSAFMGGWSRMTARQRRDALQALADQGLPAGVRITIGAPGDA